MPKPLIQYVRDRMKNFVQFRVKVKSKSQEGLYYLVTAFKNGTMDCDCTFGRFGGECSHKQKAADWYYKNKEKK